MQTTPRYLGDGVYAHFDGYQIWLEAEGMTDDQRLILNRIALDGRTFAALMGYQQDLVAELEAAHREQD